jgi:glucan biosynthesis protein C
MEQSRFGAGQDEKGTRPLWYLHWIRGYAMLLGVPFHVGLIYSNGTPWFLTSPEKSQVVTIITGLLTSFRMPLFFCVAGLLSAVSLSRRRPVAWLMRRSERLGVPLLASSLAIGPIVFASAAYAASRGSSFEKFRMVFHQLLARPGVHWVGHLWFLQVLLLYSPIAVVALPALRQLKPSLLPRDEVGTLTLPLPGVFGAAFAVTLYTLGEKGTMVLSRFAFEDPFWGMLRLHQALDFLPFFLIGLFIHDVRLPPIYRSPTAWAIIGFSLLFFAGHWNEPAIFDKVIRYTCNGMVAVLGGCVILVLTSRLVTAPNRVTEFLAASSFTVYLVHYPIIVWLGTIFVPVHWDPLVEYLTLVLITLVLAFLVHKVVSHSRTLRFLFNGTRCGVLEKHTLSRRAPELPGLYTGAERQAI